MGFLTTLIVCLATLYFVKVDAETIPIGNWTYYAHGAHGGQVTILDKKRIQIENFNYDGRGPEAWFQAGLFKLGNDNVPHPCANHRRHPIIPDDKGQCANKPAAYTDAKLILTIPHEYNWEDIDYVGLYCYKYQHLFGFIKIPQLDSSKLDAATEKGADPCTEHDRIIADTTSPVTCGFPETWKVNTGSFP